MYIVAFLLTNHMLKNVFQCDIANVNISFCLAIFISMNCSFKFLIFLLIMYYTDVFST